MVARKVALKASLVFLTGAFLAGALNVIYGCSYRPFERAPVESASPLSGSFYHVRPGDTLWSISRSFGFSLSELAAHNGIEDASLLKVSQQLYIPLPQESDEFLWPALGNYSFSKDRGGITLDLQSGSRVRSSRSGRVVLAADSLSSLGPTVVLDHGNSLHTVYAGLEEVFVRPGEFARQGSALGRTAEKPLYFEIRREGETQDTLILLPRL